MLLVKQMDTLKKKVQINTQFAPADKIKNVSTKYTELLDKINNLIKKR